MHIGTTLESSWNGQTRHSFIALLAGSQVINVGDGDTDMLMWYYLADVSCTFKVH